jgi:hypothetical protein
MLHLAWKSTLDDKTKEYSVHPFFQIVVFNDLYYSEKSKSFHIFYYDLFYY